MLLPSSGCCVDTFFQSLGSCFCLGTRTPQISRIRSVTQSTNKLVALEADGIGKRDCLGWILGSARLPGCRVAKNLANECQKGNLLISNFARINLENLCATWRHLHLAQQTRPKSDSRAYDAMTRRDEGVSFNSVPLVVLVQIIWVTSWASNRDRD